MFRVAIAMGRFEKKNIPKRRNLGVFAVQLGNSGPDMCKLV